MNESILKKPPERPYQICIVGNDNDVARAAIVLHKLGCYNFHHAAKIGKLNKLEFASHGGKSHHMYETLHKYHIKTRRFTFLDAQPKDNVLDGTEDSSDASNESIPVSESGDSGTKSGGI